MKRLIAFMAVFALIFSLTFVPVKAEGTAWSLPFSKLERLIEVAEQLFSGAEVNLAEISGQMLGLYDYILAYEDYIDENGIYVPTLTYDQAQALQLGISSLALSGQDVLTADSDITIPIKSSDIANFIGYRTNWIDRYASNADVIVVNPDPDYSAQLNRINLQDATDNTAFWFYDVPQYQPNSVNNLHIVSYPTSNYSWITYSGYQFPTSVGSLQTPYMFPDDIITINITSGVSGYSYSVSGTSVGEFTTNNSNRFWQYGYFDNTNGFSMSGLGTSYITPPGISYSFSKTNVSLQTCLNDIALHFRNVNIYVDGVAWSLAGSNDVADPFLQLGAVALGDLGTITFPVYTLDQEGDLGLDLGAFADWLDSVIKSGATALSLEDLIADGIPVVDTVTGERSITEDDEEDVAKVIAGAKATTAPTGSPTPTPDPDDDKKIPILKIIPPILDPVDDIWPDGGRDTTVLAQIIHSTDVIMPDDIMTILWSIIGVMVVGGLLMILHK